jgi:hypothetical protein
MENEGKKEITFNLEQNNVLIYDPYEDEPLSVSQQAVLLQVYR